MTASEIFCMVVWGTGAAALQVWLCSPKQNTTDDGQYLPLSTDAQLALTPFIGLFWPFVAVIFAVEHVRGRRPKG